MSEKILVINGPNLNLLGTREKDKYGSVSLQDIQKKCESHSDKIGLKIDFKQSNVEGEIVNFILQKKLMIKIILKLCNLSGADK